jgi:SAM-dependent methyltransferase
MRIMNTSTDWFASWFDTKFYHILYKHRDHKEARLFMANLVSFLHLKKGDNVLDLACGKGRHSVFLNSLGLDVIGADLSKNSIQVLENIKNGLKNSDSVAIIDFLNVEYAVKNLVEKEVIVREEATFNIKKSLNNGYIIKEIEVVVNGESSTYFERIKYLDLPKMESYLKKVGLKLKHTFGDYDLNGFDVETSNRLILIISK